MEGTTICSKGFLGDLGMFVQRRRLRLVQEESARSTWEDGTPKAVSRSLRHLGSMEATFSKRKKSLMLGKTSLSLVVMTRREAAMHERLPSRPRVLFFFAEERSWQGKPAVTRR